MSTRRAYEKSIKPLTQAPCLCVWLGMKCYHMTEVFKNKDARFWIKVHA